MYRRSTEQKQENCQVCEGLAKLMLECISEPYPDTTRYNNPAKATETNEKGNARPVV